MASVESCVETTLYKGGGKGQGQVILMQLHASQPDGTIPQPTFLGSIPEAVYRERYELYKTSEGDTSVMFGGVTPPTLQEGEIRAYRAYLDADVLALDELPVASGAYEPGVIAYEDPRNWLPRVRAAAGMTAIAGVAV